MGEIEKRKSSNSDNMNKLRVKRVESYQETENEGNPNTKIKNPNYFSKSPPWLNMIKAKSDSDFFNNIGSDHSLPGNISPSNNIKTPLPISTCSKRLTKAK